MITPSEAVRSARSFLRLRKSLDVVTESGSEVIDAQVLCVRRGVDDVLSGEGGGRNIIVIPAGLGLNEAGEHELSFAYQALIDWVIENCQSDDVVDGNDEEEADDEEGVDVVFLAPGNPFGAQGEDGRWVCEQEIAAQVLEESGFQGRVVMIPSPENDYADLRNYLTTRDNAVGLREQPAEKWASGPNIIVAYDLQAPRAWEVFRQEFQGSEHAMDGVVAVRSSFSGKGDMVPDLQYYKSRLEHFAYELKAFAFFALGLDKWKWLKDKMVKQKSEVEIG